MTRQKKTDHTNHWSNHSKISVFAGSPSTS